MMNKSVNTMAKMPAYEILLMTASTRNDLELVTRKVLKTKKEVADWKASLHTLCLPVPHCHAQNVNHFPSQFSRLHV